MDIIEFGPGRRVGQERIMHLSNEIRITRVGFATVDGVRGDWILSYTDGDYNENTYFKISLF